MNAIARILARILLLVAAALQLSAQVLQPVQIGVNPGDGTGDPLRAAFQKINANDAALWQQAFVDLPAQITGGAGTGSGLNSARAFRTVTEMLSFNPTELASNPVTNSVWTAYAWTSGDTVANSGGKWWRFDPASAVATNTLANNGPLAAPWNALSGRWFYVADSTTSTLTSQIASKVGFTTNGVAGYVAQWIGTNQVGPSLISIDGLQQFLTQSGAGGTNTIYVPPSYTDSASSPTNSDPTVAIQALIDAASNAYTTNGGALRLTWGPGHYWLDELTVMPNMEWQALGDVFIHRRTDWVSGTVNRGMITTRRVNGIAIDPTNNCFAAWNSSPADYSKADNWYGLSDNVKWRGPGRFWFIVGTKSIGQPPILLNEVRNWLIEPGVIAVSHGGVNAKQWAVRIGGRNVTWYYPIVLNGSQIGQDGVHTTHGYGINYVGGWIESYDDAFPFGTEYFGGSNVGPDEPLRNCTVIGAYCASKGARGMIAYSGYNYVQVPVTNGGLTVEGIRGIGLNGWVAQGHGMGLYFGHFPPKDKIYSYTIANGGSGYPNGVYTNCTITPDSGGGSNARCTVIVRGGVIVAATPTYINGTWLDGSGYSADGTVSLSSIPAGGSGGSVRSVAFRTRNDLVRNITCSANFLVGSTNHDNVEPYGLKVDGVTGLNLDYGFSIIENSSSRQHRPYLVLAGDELVLKLSENTVTSKGGVITTADNPYLSVGSVTFRDCWFNKPLDAGNFPVKVLGRVGQVTVQDSHFRNMTNNRAGLYVRDIENSKTNSIGILKILNNRFVPESSSPVGVMAWQFDNTGGIGGQVGHFIVEGNDLSKITTWNTATEMAASVAAWDINSNTGLDMVSSKTVTLGAGSTTLSVSVTPRFGLPNGTSSGLSMVTANPIGNWGSATKIWLTATDATSYTINVDIAPGGSGLPFAITERTNHK